MNEIAQVLREKGMKVTPQRIAIYTMLMNTKEHPSAETIYHALEATNPTMSLATVYKTLDSFVSANLVQQLQVGGGYSRYDADTSCHPHFICECCGEVYDFQVPGLDKIKEQVQPFTDFKINNEQHFFYGVCKKCQN